MVCTDTVNVASTAEFILEYKELAAKGTAHELALQAIHQRLHGSETAFSRLDSPIDDNQLHRKQIIVRKRK